MTDDNPKPQPSGAACDEARKVPGRCQGRPGVGAPLGGRKCCGIGVDVDVGVGGDVGGSGDRGAADLGLGTGVEFDPGLVLVPVLGGDVRLGLGGGGMSRRTCERALRQESRRRRLETV